MNQANILDTPAIYAALEQKCEEVGFTMPSDIYIGTLLKSLIASKRGANVLELGTGISLSLAWMIDGLDEQGRVTSIDYDAKLIEIAQGFFEQDPRVTLVCADGSDWLKSYKGAPFDLIFADAWSGKFYDLEETLELVKVGGFYVIDDLNPATGWPEGHAEKVAHLIDYLENRPDFTMTKMNWSTGVILCTKTE